MVLPLGEQGEKAELVSCELNRMQDFLVSNSASAPPVCQVNGGNVQMGKCSKNHKHKGQKGP